VECSVCGFNLEGPVACPACGKESQFEETNDSTNSENPIMDIEIEESEPTNEINLESQIDEIPYSSMAKSQVLPFDIEDAPTFVRNETLPYGLDSAPIHEK
jgi:uncharacterized Zn finger protein (UPF0148 family)